MPTGLPIRFFEIFRQTSQPLDISYILYLINMQTIYPNISAFKKVYFFIGVRRGSGMNPLYFFNHRIDIAVQR